MCGTESTLNSRPITYVSTDLNDLIPLTPNHFLCQLGKVFAPDVPDDEAIKPHRRSLCEFIFSREGIFQVHKTIA